MSFSPWRQDCWRAGVPPHFVSNARNSIQERVGESLLSVLLPAFAKSRRGGEKPHRAFNPITRLAKKAHKEATIIVIGGGPAGSPTAPPPSSIGRRSTADYRTRIFSRFHTGESLSGECCAGLRTLDINPRSRPKVSDKTRRQGVQPAPACRFRKGEGGLRGDQCAHSDVERSVGPSTLIDYCSSDA